MPFHGGGDASNDGKSFNMSQYNDLPAGEEFTVTSHTPYETVVLLTRKNQLHTIPHNEHSRLHIAVILEQLSDIAWVHSYIPGPQNTLYGGLSRYPLLGSRVLAHRYCPSFQNPRLRSSTHAAHRSTSTSLTPPHQPH